eukprot:TRINITY_DN69614_c0_g1_i1.p1 TRINITY_DN69614_c0_g1~~TRINITY_DN69614_c0_g1_i1.p1  ORF type:complete len:289 (-),score=28.80 TRINITY_DN69614_c0_g1_i1:517-1332(-)
MFGMKCWWEVDRAKSNRSKCKLCKNTISLNEVRLGWTTEPDDHWGTNWGYFHPLCAVRKQHMKGFHEVDFDDLKGFDTLSSAEKKELRKVFEGKKPMKRKRDESSSDSSASSDSSESDSGSSSSSSDSASDSDSSSSSSSSDDGPTSKTMPQKKRPRKSAALAGRTLTAAEQTAYEEAAERFGKMKVPEIAALLQKNGMKKGGTKGEVQERAAYAVALGVPPKCPVCFGGLLQFDPGQRAFNCRGYFDDDKYVPCRATPRLEELELAKWEE